MSTYANGVDIDIVRATFVATFEPIRAPAKAKLGALRVHHRNQAQGVSW